MYNIDVMLPIFYYLWQKTSYTFSGQMYINIAKVNRFLNKNLQNRDGRKQGMKCKYKLNLPCKTNIFENVVYVPNGIKGIFGANFGVLVIWLNFSPLKRFVIFSCLYFIYIISTLYPVA